MGGVLGGGASTGGALIEVETEDLAWAARELITSGLQPLQTSVGRLWSVLDGCAGMAGSDPGGQAWARAYDRAAATAVTAAATAGNAAGQLARMFAQTARNYEAADVHSSPGARRREIAAVSAVPGVLFVSAPGCAPASAAGAGVSGGPPGWSLICDLVGHVWPNGHQDRLRHAASAWRASATSLRSAADAVLAAPDAARRHFLPEAPDMLLACTGASDRLREIADLHDSLADACLQLADRIDRVHAEVIDELESLVEWSAGIQVAGGVLSAFTFGVAEVPTQAAEAARIARTAELVGACIQRFTEAASAIAAGIGSIGERAAELGDRLRRLLEIPLLQPALVGVGSVRVMHEMRDVQAVVRLEREAQAPILSAAEAAGGHTIERHVALTDAELIDRGIPEASTFKDLETAERVTADNIANNRRGFEKWMRSGVRKLTIDSPVAPDVGRVYISDRNVFVHPRTVRTVFIRRDGQVILLSSHLLP